MLVSVRSRAELDLALARRRLTMITKKLYLEAPHLLATTAVVTNLGVDAESRPWVTLDCTVFHAQGGGQKADRGTINGRTVTHVAHAVASGVVHYIDSIESLAVGLEVDLVVDETWRRINARHHSGGHLIASLVEARFPILHAVSGHHWPGQARVEFDGESSSGSSVAAEVLERDIAKAISEGAPVKVVGDPHTDRSVQIGDYPPVACGGTHVGNVSELDGLHIDKVRMKSGRVRVSYGFMI